MKKYKSRKYIELRPFLMMVAFIVAGAVIIGYFGTRYIVYPVFLKNEADTQTIEQYSDSNANHDIPETSDEQLKDTTEKGENEEKAYIYHVQLGHFSIKHNADLLIEEAKKDGVFTYVLEGDGYKVVTTPCMSYNQADKIKEKMQIYAPDAFVLKRKINLDNTSVKNTIENILNDLNEVHMQSNVSDEWVKKLKNAFQYGLGDSQMKEKTMETFQSIYEEINKIENIQNNDLFELEKMIIMKVEEII